MRRAIAVGVAVIVCLGVAVAYSDVLSTRPPFVAQASGPLDFGPGGGGMAMAKTRQDQFATLWVCTKTDRGVRVSNLSFEAKVEGEATPRFMVNFEGFGEASVGAGPLGRLPSSFRKVAGAAGEIRPCGQVDGMVEIALILERDEPVGVLAEGFEMTYTVDGQEYTTRSDTYFGICASQGSNPARIAEGCEE